MRELPLTFDLLLLAFGLALLVNFALEADTISQDFICEDNYSAPDCGYILGEALLFLLLGVQCTLAPGLARCLPFAYLVTAFVALAAVVMEVVFMVAFRTDSFYKVQTDQYHNLVYGRSFLFLGGALLLAFSAGSSWALHTYLKQ